MTRISYRESDGRVENINWLGRAPNPRSEIPYLAHVRLPEFDREKKAELESEAKEDDDYDPETSNVVLVYDEETKGITYRIEG